MKPFNADKFYKDVMEDAGFDEPHEQHKTNGSNGTADEFSQRKRHKAEKPWPVLDADAYQRSGRHRCTHH